MARASQARTGARSSPAPAAGRPWTGAPELRPRADETTDDPAPRSRAPTRRAGRAAGGLCRDRRRGSPRHCATRRDRDRCRLDQGAVDRATWRRILPDGVHFVPGHPVAGTEHSGPDAGFAELFEGRWCILTPPPGRRPGGGRAGCAACGSGSASIVRPMDARASRPGAGDHLAPAASDRLHHRRHRRPTSDEDTQSEVLNSPPAASATSPASPPPTR